MLVRLSHVPHLLAGSSNSTKRTLSSADLVVLLNHLFSIAVSRSATAPFDRLKVFLITDSTLPDASDIKPVVSKTFQGFENLKRATMRLYINGGGLRSFWVGNGLNVIKIMPESAIKFFSYESSKRFLARYWDKVDDPSLISGSSRFLSGGIGGLTSQFAIYPVSESASGRLSRALSHCSAADSTRLFS